MLQHLTGPALCLLRKRPGTVSELAELAARSLSSSRQKFPFLSSFHGSSCWA